MKQITVFEASDGTRFDSAEKCLDHDRLAIAVAEAMLPLAPEIDISGERFVQREKEDCLQAKRNLLAIIRKKFTWFFKDKWATVADDDIHPGSILGRVIDDSDCRPLNKAWGRLYRINWENFREYEQPYFANHPDQATEEIPL